MIVKDTRVRLSKRGKVHRCKGTLIKHGWTYCNITIVLDKDTETTEECTCKLCERGYNEST